VELIDHLRMMAAYNAWANGRLYDAAATLPDEDYRADRGAFFRSVHGTLNHLLVTDRIWIARLSEVDMPALALDDILFEQLADLRAAREEQDRIIIAFVEGLHAADLQRAVRYRRVTSPDMFEQPIAPALGHLLNHQTHHRGQVHAILTGLQGQAPELDLLLYQRLAGVGTRKVAS
jgi:uncharacterized damage-inducible protein DinB